MKLVLALTVIVLIAFDAGSAPTLSPVSLQHRASASGSGNSFAPVFSDDGRLVVFVSQAKDLASNGIPSPFLDLFVRSLGDGRTTLVTVNTNGAGGGDADSSFASISADGRYIAFESAANNLTPNDTNGLRDVFLRDLVSGTTRLLSIKTNVVLSGNGHSQAPRISSDGGRVVFESFARDLATNDFNGSGSDVFVCDLPSGRIQFVSLNSSGTGGPVGPATGSPGGGTSGALGGTSDSVSVSADSRFVAFRSTATNVVTGTSNRFGEIFVRDLENQTTIWASQDPGSHFAQGLPYACVNPAISPDGRYVIYVVMEVFNSSGPRFLRRYEMATGLTLDVTNSLNQLFQLGDAPPIISPDGQVVAYETLSPTGWTLADLDSGVFEPLHAPGLNGSRAPIFSADNSRVAFFGATSTSGNGPWSVYVRALRSSTQELVSVTTNGAAAEISNVSEPVISADGRLVAFESAADNLVADDFNQASDVFVRVLETIETQLVSARANGLTPARVARSVMLTPRSLSVAGRSVAFTSLDNHLAERDDNPWQDAFVRDTVTGTNEVLRSSSSGILPGSPRLAFSPVLSANGRYAAWFEQAMPEIVTVGMATNILWLDRVTRNSAVLGFAGAALPNLGPPMSLDGRWIAFQDRPPSATFTNVYVRDMLSSDASNHLVSVNRFGTSPGDGHSSAPVISPDSRLVAFVSKARDLTTNSLPFVSQVFTRDLVTGVTRLISTDSTGRFGLAGECSNPMFSSDSRYVFFSSRDTVSPSNILYRHSLSLSATNQNEIVCAGCANPSTSADGRFVAFDSRPLSSNRDIYVRDMRDRTTTLITTNISPFSYPPSGDRSSYSSQISHDGRYVVFASQARNLVANDTNNLTDIFVHDRIQRATMAISTSTFENTTANSLSSSPVLAPDGRTIAFVSFATDLAPGDFNNARDIYVLHLGGPDTDEDQMDDDWEVTYFGNLDHDGAADSDSDGSTDLQEFNLGTDPTDRGSIFKVLTVSLVGGITRTIYWVSTPGRSYRVQLKFDLKDAEWQYLPGRVTATGTTASYADHGSTLLSPPRFYRVELEQ